MKNFKKKLTQKDWEAIKKLPMAERYHREIDSRGVTILTDQITKEVHSMKRDIKKQMKETLKYPSGRQLKKLKRYLKSLNNENKSS